MAHKPSILFVVAVVVSSFAASSAEAQGRRRGRVSYQRPVVFVGAYHPFHPFLFDQWYPYPYGVYPPFGFTGGDYTGSIRMQVTPREAEVYVDGYLAGNVDDFDGVFQRLQVLPGQHDIVVYLDGHRTIQQNIYVTPGRSLSIRQTLAPLGPGETNQGRPQAPATPPTPFPPRGPAAPVTSVPGSRFGNIQIRVQPADAAVFIDGEPWQGPEFQQALVVQVFEGLHTVEVRKVGYETFVTRVQVRAGDTATLNVSLLAQDRTP